MIKVEHQNTEQPEDRLTMQAGRAKGEGQADDLSALGVGTHPTMGRSCSRMAMPSLFPQMGPLPSESVGPETSLSTRTGSRGTGIKVCPGIPTADLRVSGRPQFHPPVPCSCFCLQAFLPPQRVKPTAAAGLLFPESGESWGDAS